MDIRKRITDLLKAKGANMTQLAEHCGVSPQAVQQWIAKGRMPRPERLRQISSFFGITEAQLFQETSEDGRGYLVAVPTPTPEQTLRVEEPLNSYSVAQSKFREVPVIGKAMGGISERIWDDAGYPVGVSDEYAEIATQDPNAFIIPVEGGSMAPRYNPGEFALVEPNTEPEIEDDVLVRFRNDGTCLKRLLSRRGGFVRLGSYATSDVITCREDEIVWMYYVAHPIPVRKIKSRL
jgi:phage repressor protein C with HTH and peptisase S24 domain